MEAQGALMSVKKVKKKYNGIVNFTKLRLVSPLYYRPFAGLSPGLFAETLSRGEGAGETLFCFEINPAQAFSIEPAAGTVNSGADNSGVYLGPLLAAGSAAAGAALLPAALVLPAGDYFFTQIRGNDLRSADEIIALYIEMAVELQKEGLWERLKLGQTVNFRTLWEDGARVFQALRPFTA
jgi:hypothetical protein